MSSIYETKLKREITSLFSKIQFENNEFYYEKLPVDSKNESNFVISLGSRVYEFYKSETQLKDLKDYNYTKEILSIYEKHKPPLAKGWKAGDAIDVNGNLIIEKNNYEKKLIQAGTFLTQDFPLRKGVEIETKSHFYSKAKQIRRISPDADYEDDSFLFITGRSFLDNTKDVSSNCRFYFNFNPDTGDFKVTLFEFIDKLITKVNERSIPFIFKVLRSKSKFVRADSAVFYINRRHYYSVIDLVISLAKDFKPILREIQPAFTYPLTYGVGFGEQPPFERSDKLFFEKTPSFGEHRSRLIASIIFKLIREGKLTEQSLLSELNNISNSSSSGTTKNFYQNKITGLPDNSYALYSSIYTNNDARVCGIPITQKLANLLFSEAVFDYWGRCNWLRYSEATNNYVSLDTDLAEGLAGIVFFINHFSDTAGSNQSLLFREASLKTLDYKLADRYYFTDKKLTSKRKRIRGGFFKGDLMGIYILLVSKYKGFVLKTDMKLSERITSKLIVDETDFSLWSGISGSIVALCKLFEFTSDCIYIEKAKEIGDKILNFNIWKDLEATMKYGRSGLMLALNILHEKTNDNKYKTKVEALIDYDQLIWKSHPEELWDKTIREEYFKIEFGKIITDIFISRTILTVEKYPTVECDLQMIKIVMNRIGDFNFSVLDEDKFSFINSEIFAGRNATLDAVHFEHLVDFNNFTSENFNPTLFNGLAGIGMHLLREIECEKTKNLPRIFHLLT
jgi:hypothetical protein